MAGIKIEKEPEIELNLTAVKQLTQQDKSFGLENAGDPICQWRLLDNALHLNDDYFIESDLFRLKNCDLIAQLNLAGVSADGDYILILKLLDSKKARLITTIDRFQLFICKFKIFHSSGDESCFLSIDAFNLSSSIRNVFEFIYWSLRDSATISVELYQEPSAMVEYRSPYKNVVVGKIEKFKEMTEKTYFQDIDLIVSPRFHFGSPGQLMIVKFSYSKHRKASRFSAHLRILNKRRVARGAPFAFTATFTIFSQAEKVKDSISKVFYARDENKINFTKLLAFSHELDPYLQDDTLYYKVHIEPHPSE